VDAALYLVVERISPARLARARRETGKEAADRGADGRPYAAGPRKNDLAGRTPHEQASSDEVAAAHEFFRGLDRRRPEAKQHRAASKEPQLERAIPLARAHESPRDALDLTPVRGPQIRGGATARTCRLRGVQVNHRWGTIAALCRIGFAALALGDVVAAAGNLRDALERAHASEAISLELLALSGIGAVLTHTSRRVQATTMLVFTLGHEQLPPAYSFAARPALDALEAELPPEQLAAARAAAAEARLDDLVDQALGLVAGE